MSDDKTFLDWNEIALRFCRLARKFSLFIFLSSRRRILSLPLNKWENNLIAQVWITSRKYLSTVGFFPFASAWSIKVASRIAKTCAMFTWLKVIFPLNRRRFSLAACLRMIFRPTVSITPTWIHLFLVTVQRVFHRNSCRQRTLTCNCYAFWLHG